MCKCIMMYTAIIDIQIIDIQSGLPQSETASESRAEGALCLPYTLPYVLG